MSARFEELAWARTPIGDVSLRRRREPVTGTDVHEVKLGDEFLMSSMFTVSEEELARRALARITGTNIRVVVGGLGLGYTARAVLEDQRVSELTVIETLQPVIDWHQEHLVPLGEQLTTDPRCRLLHGDFFAMSRDGGFHSDPVAIPVDAIIVDIDHSPRHLLADDSTSFYQPSGTQALARLLRPAGVYALWSNDPPDESYLEMLRPEFTDVHADIVTFPNPLQGGQSTSTVYLATRPA
ncbi:spermidine synthase [Serinicoccus sediminis]|uniref:spermidine synthase n=1 Tax=Serinicoccus sediminis TaxID=2306021 RepID=UPI0010228B12|nr:spermidine synthase [Serinicoccus sediminis]